MSSTASVSYCHNAMKVFPCALAVDAASWALRSGDVCRAVELLEQGRTLIWTQMARFHTPLDSLQEADDHAKAVTKKFQDLSSLLDNPPANHSEGTLKVDAEAEATHYTHLVEEWNTTVEEIQKLKGLSRFLLPPLFSELQDATCGGPIIVLIASKLYCHAIIVLHKESPVNVGLAINTGEQPSVPGEKGKLVEALRELWVEIMHPVVENLSKFAKPGSRIWWCPTSFFNFMPLHAAGEYRRGGKSLAQLYISSYTPSLTVLIKARRRHDQPLPMLFATIEPFKSVFLMCDELLSLLDITQMDLSSHSFAFLSACETAVSNFHPPDEVIHLVPALQFAGVNSVVRTLWEVNDIAVQHLVKAFYEKFCGDGTMNSKRTARALYRAVQSLADDKDMPLDQRIVFVHIGI
ncbi:CHAT domain-containing protein [Suillus subluteus]|nr:CHAT domain-containing protein [Suillus subluteus]